MWIRKWKQMKQNDLTKEEISEFKENIHFKIDLFTGKQRTIDDFL